MDTAGVGAAPASVVSEDDRRLANFGYTPQLNRVLGLFGNFAVAFTYLSPMVGIYSLFLLGVGTGGPAYLWLTIIPVVGMVASFAFATAVRAIAPGSTGQNYNTIPERNLFGLKEPPQKPPNAGPHSRFGGGRPVIQ